MQFYRELDSCRICNSSFADKTLKLIESPLANEIYSDPELAKSADLFPLEVVMCQTCLHIQLRHIVKPERLFSDYVYASGTSLIFRRHFEELADRIHQIMGIGKVLEIGSNDGSLLDSLTALGIQAIGIEPSPRLTKKCIERGLEVYTNFLNKELSIDLRVKHTEFDLIVGNNVFAHIDDLPEAFGLVNNLLKENGFFIFEVAHSLSMVENLLFDTIYHEHMSYHSVISLSKFMPGFGFEIFDVEEIEMHGGSIRVVCRKTSNNNLQPTKKESILDIINREKEAELDSSAWMDLFARRLLQLKATTLSAILAQGEGIRWIGYGAPAKSVTFLNEFNLYELGIIGIIDDNLDKQGNYLPKSGIKIMSRDEMLGTLEDELANIEIRCIVFPWNLSNEIVDRLVDFSKFRVKLVWFLPEYVRVGLNNENVD